jgi:hypothetical protein
VQNLNSVAVLVISKYFYASKVTVAVAIIVIMKQHRSTQVSVFTATSILPILKVINM